MVYLKFKVWLLVFWGRKAKGIRKVVKIDFESLSGLGTYGDPKKDNALIFFGNVL